MKVKHLFLSLHSLLVEKEEGCILKYFKRQTSLKALL
jgi:hypothetical protein